MLVLERTIQIKETHKTHPDIGHFNDVCYLPSDKAGLHLNVKRTEIMDRVKCEKDAVVEFDGEEIERIERFEYLGVRIEANGKTTPEIRRLAIAPAKLNKMANIWNGQCKDTKVRIL